MPAALEVSAGSAMAPVWMRAVNSRAPIGLLIVALRSRAAILAQERELITGHSLRFRQRFFTRQGGLFAHLKGLFSCQQHLLTSRWVIFTTVDSDWVLLDSA